MLISLFLVFVSWYSITYMSLLNPSNTISITIINSFDYVLLFVLFPLCLASMFLFLLHTKKIIPFFILLFLIAFFSVLLVWYTASTYHRDYITLFFQIAILLFSTVIIQFPNFIIFSNRIKIVKVLTQTGLIILFGCLGWIILMGYSIVTRSEPRWIESIVYNIHNVFILGFLAYSIARLQQETYKIVYLTPSSCLLNERNLASHLTEREIAILNFFVRSNDNSCSCSSLLSFLSSANLLEHPGDYDCYTCITEKWSAINCKFYRNIKNQLTALKKSLELIEIGTIVNMSPSFRDNKEQGWKLKFFNDVIVSSQKKQFK